MQLLSAIPSVVFLIFYLLERARTRHLQEEILYITKRLDAFCQTPEGGILVPSEHPSIQQLSAALNRVSDSFYAHRADFERSRQAMKQMVSNISHDLRTPLTVLKGCLELLKKEMRQLSSPPDTGKITELAKLAEKAYAKAEELAAVADACFTISKIESGDMHLDIRQTDVTQLCHEILLDYYDILQKERFDVQIQTGSVPVYADTDGEAFTRILKNLTDNAILHGGCGKYLGIRLTSTAGSVQIEVEDHGPGISPNEQAQIFSRNYTTARGRCGSGLGLAIAKNLALQMNADITVMSIPGEKTIFTIHMKNSAAPDTSNVRKKLESR